MDRFDCMMLMLPFVSIYMQEIVKGHLNSFSTVIFYFMKLSKTEQLQLLEKLQSIAKS